YKELIDLKRLYRVSGAALLMRLRQLDVISEGILIYIFQTIGRGWRSQEPQELEGPEKRGQYERALRFERLCYRALAEELISLSKAAELLRQPVPDVEAGLKGPQNANADHCQWQQLPYRSQEGVPVGCLPATAVRDLDPEYVIRG